MSKPWVVAYLNQVTTAKNNTYPKQYSKVKSLQQVITNVD
jgi:hypothetical protein